MPACSGTLSSAHRRLPALHLRPQRRGDVSQQRMDFAATTTADGLRVWARVLRSSCELREGLPLMLLLFYRYAVGQVWDKNQTVCDRTWPSGVSCGDDMAQRGFP
mmetsp:Transcript_24715/g.98103  ORF Transcript_24715/g.98103 Transcript_24715/m.98103 type:complete len:105 (-) Transcript_24715:30-344(-)